MLGGMLLRWHGWDRVWQWRRVDSLRWEKLLVIPWFNNLKFNFHRTRSTMKLRRKQPQLLQCERNLLRWIWDEISWENWQGGELLSFGGGEKEVSRRSRMNIKRRCGMNFTKVEPARPWKSLSTQQWLRSSETSVSLRSSASELVIWWNFNLTRREISTGMEKSELRLRKI